MYSPPLPRPPTEKERLASLGTPALILAILDLVQDALGIGGHFVTGRLLDLLQRLPGALGRQPHGGDELLANSRDLLHRVGEWNALRLVPFALASVFLIPIALRLRRGDASALVDVRKWAVGAFVVLGLSLALQLLVILPANLAYQRAILAPTMRLANGAHVPEAARTILSLTRSLTEGSVWIGALGGFLAMGAWPVVSYVLASRWLRLGATPKVAS